MLEDKLSYEANLQFAESQARNSTQQIRLVTVFQKLPAARVHNMHKLIARKRRLQQGSDG